MIKLRVVLALILSFLTVFPIVLAKKKEPVKTKAEVVYVDIIPDIQKADMFLAECTAYTAGYESTGKSPGDAGYGITSSGKKVRQGYVAADIRILPYGTLIYIDGMGVYEVQDTGSAIKGCRIDIYYDNLTDALNFGRQKRNIIVLHKG